MSARPQTRWWEDAACSGDTLFHKTDSAVTEADLTAMRKTCTACPVNAECLADALERKESATVRSGWTSRERSHAAHAGTPLTPGGPVRTPRRRRKPQATHDRKSRTPWTPKDDALVLTTGYGDDVELAEEIGRSVWAVRNRRVRLRRAAKRQEVPA